MMYLLLSVAGHLTIFLTRTRGPFWSIRPARILLLAVLGTQTIATLIAVYGLFMHPLGWKWAAFVWAYAIIWALASDRIKLFAYRILDPTGGSSAANGVLTIDSAAFYTATDLRDPVFHDNTDCPYGRELKTHHNDQPGTDHRRRCDWCAQHDQPVALKS
jgi:H+-transporting ATPase